MGFGELFSLARSLGLVLSNPIICTSMMFPIQARLPPLGAGGLVDAGGLVAGAVVTPLGVGWPRRVLALVIVLTVAPVVRTFRDLRPSFECVLTALTYPTLCLLFELYGFVFLHL
jgi:hypothetical protein